MSETEATGTLTVYLLDGTTLEFRDVSAIYCEASAPAYGWVGIGGGGGYVAQHAIKAIALKKD